MLKAGDPITYRGDRLPGYPATAYQGVVTFVHDDGTADVRWDDGEELWMDVDDLVAAAPPVGEE